MHSLKVKNMSIENAKELGALAMFGEKYGDVVRVVDVPGVSMELCGNDHLCLLAIAKYRISSKVTFGSITAVPAASFCFCLEVAPFRALVVLSTQGSQPKHTKKQ